MGEPVQIVSPGRIPRRGSSVRQSHVSVLAALAVGACGWPNRTASASRKLADDARISTFDRLGENSRARAILERRLGEAGGDAA
jgi:hypothetical protein